MTLVALQVSSSNEKTLVFKTLKVIFMQIYNSIIYSKKGLLAWATLLIGLCFTMIFSFYLEKNDLQEIEHSFSLNNDQIQTKLQERFNLHILIIQNAVARVRSIEKLSRANFKSYIEDIQFNEYTKGIYGIGVNWVVPQHELEAFEKKIRKNDFPDFSVKPAGKRDTYTPVTYIEPFNEINSRAIGFDTYSNPIRKKAQDLARDTGKIAITKKIDLVQDSQSNQKTPGFILFSPIYKKGMPLETIDQRRRAIQAFISYPFQVKSLMDGLLTENDLKNGISLQIFPQDDHQKVQPIYSLNSHIHDSDKSLFTEIRSLRIDDQSEWKMEFKSKAKSQTIHTPEGLITLISGSILSLIAFLYVLSQTHLKEDSTMKNVILNNKVSTLNNRLSLALDSANMGVWDFDVNSNQLIWDKKQFEIFGIDENNFEGLLSSWENSLYIEDKESAKQAFQDALHGKSGFNTEFRIIKNGEIRYIKGQAIVLKDENQKPTRITGVNFDITESKVAQQSLEIEKNKAQTANIAKSKFLARMSHEIRTPLNGIIGITSLALRTSPTSEVQEYFNKISYSSKSLLTILNEVLDFSKIESHKLKIIHEPFNFQNLFTQSNDLFAPSSALKENTLIFEIDSAIPKHLIGDEFRIRQILFNLIGNVIKFSNKGTITVTAKLNRIVDQIADIDFMIQDTGIGIAEEDISKILLPFEQADDKIARKFGGTGLGLTISQELLKLMNSRLMIKSKLRLGTQVSFHLSLQINPNQNHIYLNNEDLIETTIKSEDVEDFSGKHVLVVEDNPINSEIMCQMLKLSNINISTASNGLECLDRIASDTFDIILMDIQMPLMDGYEATRIIRTIKELKKLPIIGVSAGLRHEDKDNFIDKGLSDVLNKPFTVEDLNLVLKKWL